jgi:hypothetical protein
LFCLAGCESAQTSAAHKIANLLPRAIGPAQRYQVQVKGNLFALAGGHANEITVSGEEVQVAPHALLNTLNLDAQDVTFNTQTHRLEKAGRVSFIGTVDQQDLSRYLEAVHPHSDVSVVIGARNLIAKVPVQAMGMETTASVSGTLAPDPAMPAHLDFIANRAEIGVLPVPAFLVNTALRLVNPIFDLSHIKVPFAVTHVSVLDNVIVLRGTVDLNNFQLS